MAKEDEPTRSSPTARLWPSQVKPLLGMQFATIFSLALGISLLAPFLADQRGISPAVVAILGGIGSLGAVMFGLAVARSQWLQQRPLTGIAIAIGMVMGAAGSRPLHASRLADRAGVHRPRRALVGLGTLRRRLERDRAQRSRAAARLHPERDGGFGVLIGPDRLGQLYAIRAEGPLLASLVASAAGIPVLLLAQSRMRPGRRSQAKKSRSPPAAPLADPEAA